MRYHRPESLAHYFDLVRDLDPSQTTVLAGGTDLIPRYDHGRVLPAHLIDIKRISELRGIIAGAAGVEIGSLTSIEELKTDPTVDQHYPALRMATEDFAGKQIRHRATIGGNIVNASPAGDTLTPLYVYEAHLRIAGPDGMRTVPINQFVQGPNRVDLKPGELLHSIILPENREGSFFIKLGLRRAMAIAVVNFAIRWTATDRRFSKLSITAGAVAPTIAFLDSFTAALTIKDTSLEQALALVDDDIAPIDDIRASRNYRRMVLKNLLGYHLQAILDSSHGR